MKNPIFKKGRLTDFEKLLFREKEVEVLKKVIVKLNFKIGVLTSERDESKYYQKKFKKERDKIRKEMKLLTKELKE